MSGWLLAEWWAVSTPPCNSTWRQSTFSGSHFSHSSKEGTGFLLENETFQSNLVDAGMTVFHTYILDTTGRDQVPTWNIHLPLLPASCFLSPIVMLVFDDRSHTWSRSHSQEVFHGSGPDLRDSTCAFKQACFLVHYLTSFHGGFF